MLIIIGNRTITIQHCFTGSKAGMNIGTATIYIMKNDVLLNSIKIFTGKRG